MNITFIKLYKAYRALARACPSSTSIVKNFLFVYIVKQKQEKFVGFIKRN